MPTMVWVLLVVAILCMAIPYGKLYLWDRPRRRSKSDQKTWIGSESSVAPGAWWFRTWTKRNSVTCDSSQDIMERRVCRNQGQDHPRNRQTSNTIRLVKIPPISRREVSRDDHLQTPLHRKLRDRCQG